MKIMLDIETLGVTTTAQVIQIGAVAEDSSTFISYIAPDTSAERFSTDVDTLLWWNGDVVREAMITDIFLTGQPIEQELKRFADWMFSKHPTEVWAKGASFDLAILSYAFRQCGVNQPWVFRQERCFRTYANMFSPDYVKRLAAVDANKQPHNALADAQHQMALLQRLEAASEMLLVNLKAANDGAH